MKDLPRWLLSSLAKHLNTIAVANDIPFFVEGVHERDEDRMLLSHAELRVTGPYTKQIDSGRYNVDVVANIMLISLMDAKGDAYEIIQWGGIFQDALLSPIPVYKYGNGADDTGLLLGCLRHKKNRRDQAKLFHFGQMDRTDRVRQSELDAVLEILVSDDEL
jgi:hypothetical protein